MIGCPVSCRSCSVCGPRSARPRGALEPRAHEGLSRPKRFIVRPTFHPRRTLYVSIDTLREHGHFFGRRAALRARRSIRLVAPRGAVQWGSSGASRCKMRWGGGWTARADVGGGVFMRGYFCACDEAAGAGPREGYVAALRRRCDGETRVFGAARATLTHKISILALCGQLAFQRPGQRTKRNTKCPSPRCKLDAIPEHFMRQNNTACVNRGAKKCWIAHMCAHVAASKARSVWNFLNFGSHFCFNKTGPGPQ